MPSTVKTSGIDPIALLAIRDLELRARVVVEGLWSGLHRSPLEGFSVEFTEYRQYSPGDDLRYLDWRVLARTDRQYIKKFEDETNLRCQILLDTSRSMSFGSLDYDKAEYARTLVATLGYFLLHQRDVVGLSLFDKSIHDYLPPRWRKGQFTSLLSMLEKKPTGNATNLGRALEELGQICRKRSLVIIVSDFLSDPESWQKQMSHLAALRHDVRAIQILDPAEISLDFGRPAQWEDLETSQRIYIDPSVARKAYLDNFGKHQYAVRQILDEHGITYNIAPTDKPLDFVLLEMIQRGARSGNFARVNRRTVR